MEQCLIQIADEHTHFAAQLKVHLLESITAYDREKDSKRKEVRILHWPFGLVVAVPISASVCRDALSLSHAIDRHVFVFVYL